MEMARQVPSAIVVIFQGVMVSGDRDGDALIAAQRRTTGGMTEIAAAFAVSSLRLATPLLWRPPASWSASAPAC